MRSLLFRETVIVNETDQVVLVKDVDGIDPFDLFVENVDVAASLRTRYGSKNANVLFTYRNAGTIGNSKTVTITDVTGQPGDAFGVSEGAGSVTITLPRSASGWPTMTADQLIEALNANNDFGAVMVASRARGSDGSALVGVPSDVDPTQAPYDFSENLSGGTDASAIGDFDVFVGPTVNGPWDELADTTFDSLAAGATKKLAFVDVPVRGLKLTATMVGYPTALTLTGIARHRGI